MQTKEKSELENETEVKNYLLSFDEIKQIKFANYSIHQYKGQDILEHAEDTSEFIDNPIKKKFLVCLAQYIKDPMIIDSFTTEENRTRFEDHLRVNNPRAHKFIKRNRLRLNRIARVIGILWEEDLFTINSDLISKVNWINNQLKGNTQDSVDYYKLPNRKKIWIVQKLTYITRQAYDEIIDNL